MIQVLYFWPSSRPEGDLAVAELFNGDWEVEDHVILMEIKVACFSCKSVSTSTSTYTCS